jgi:hypothetical protein
MRMKDTLDARASETISDLQCQLDALKAENARLNAMVPQWQPIETAPKDGTEFQAWLEHGSFGYWEPRCRYSDEYDIPQIWGRTDYDEDGWDVYPHIDVTHWMPLPTPPTEKD